MSHLATASAWRWLNYAAVGLTARTYLAGRRDLALGWLLIAAACADMTELELELCSPEVQARVRARPR